MKSKYKAIQVVETAAIGLCATKAKPSQNHLLSFHIHLVRGREVGGSNPLAPDQLNWSLQKPSTASA
jgi:hypothetical protein